MKAEQLQYNIPKPNHIDVLPHFDKIDVRLRQRSSDKFAWPQPSKLLQVLFDI